MSNQEASPLNAQYGSPTHTILHLSDTHFVQDQRPMYQKVDNDVQLATFLNRLQASSVTPDAIVLTGDLADKGDPGAYQRLRAMLEPVAAHYGCQLIWVMGNHDARDVFRDKLLDDTSADMSPIDAVTEINGLRIISLDSTVPGHHHGEFDDQQLAWLQQELATPAPSGTFIAMHHPPLPTSIPLLQVVELRESNRLESIVQGTDVRGILAGHFHYPTHSLLAGIPVSVAAATCYTQDLLVPTGHTRAQNGGQGANLVHVYADRVVHSAVSVELFDTVYEVSDAEMTAILNNSPDRPNLIDS